jgi:hypothetical protein
MTDRWLITDPVLPLSVCYGVLALLTVLFVTMEWTRKSPWLALRIAAVTLMMVALAGFLFRPFFETEKSHQIILLTPGYKTSQVDSISGIYPAMDILRMAVTESYRNSAALDSYHDIANGQYDISFIVGQGLPPEALDLFESSDYQFIPSPYPQGIIRLTVQDNIVPNRTSIVEGVYNNASDTSTLFLTGPGGKEDSVSFSQRGMQRFKLSFVPKEPGNFVYSMQSENTDDKLPIRVDEQVPLKILFIQSYPTFETRYLKAFLGQQHKLILRYEVSENRYRHEFINHEPQNINRLTIESLSGFDLLIMDTEALGSLRPSEVKALETAVEGGLGLLPLYSSLPASREDLIPFRFTRYGRDTAHISLPGGTAVLPAWQVNVTTAGGTVAVLKNKNRVLSGYQYSGSGRIGFQLLQETYRLSLMGDSISYTALWSSLLEQLSARHHPEFAIRQKTDFPVFRDAPVVIEIISSGGEPLLSLNDTRLPVEEDIWIDDLWRAKFRADKAGWNRVAVEEVNGLDIYVSDDNEWKSLAIARARDKTLQAAASYGDTDEKSRIVARPVPRWIFYFAFLVGAGLLWLAPKL